MHSVDSTESRENLKNPAAKCYSHWEVNPGPLTLLPWKSQTFRSLYIHALFILGLKDFLEHDHLSLFRENLINTNKNTEIFSGLSDLLISQHSLKVLRHSGKSPMSFLIGLY